MFSNHTKFFVPFLLISTLALCIGGVIMLNNRFSEKPWQQGTKPAVGQVNSSQAMTGPVTNQWYSSLFFTEWSEPMFSFPLAYKLQAKGLGISYPRVTGTEKTSFGSYTEDLTVSLGQNFSKKSILAPDMSSVGLELCDAAEACVTTRLTHGSPVTVFTAQKDLRLVIQAPTQVTTTTDQKLWTVAFTHGSYSIGLKRNGFVSLSEVAEQNDKTIAITMKPEDRVFIALQPDDATLTEAQIGAEVTGTQFSFTTTNNTVQTELSYLTPDQGTLPLVALLPHHWQGNANSPLGTYKTLRGQQKLYATAEITTKLDAPLPLTVPTMATSLTPAEKKRLTELLQKSTDELQKTPAPVGVYEHGKYVFKTAQLLEISDAVEASSSAALRTLLTDSLVKWLSVAPSEATSPFELKDSPKGVIAKAPHTQFGNELFNDHHFHYGYFIAASGILLDSVEPEDQGQLYARLKPGLDALVSDVANLDPQNGFTLLRNFDPYEFHSWADGRALAGDGNNQESTSEAINRWYGLYRLGEAINRPDLLELGKAGWAMEREATQIYWLGQKPKLFQFPGAYQHPMASLVWGGKYDYATWFSARPSHIYGIQFLPISPAMTHVTSPSTWSKYQEYGLSDDKEAWNDIFYMVAVANGQKEVDGKAIPTELPKYEGGNSAPWYYLWVNHWLKKSK
jgi:endo-1,3(4)-beta-glucanase